MRKWTKYKNTWSLPFSYDKKNGRQQLLGVQSIKAGSHVRRKHKNKRKHKHRHKKKYVWTRATQA